MIQAYLYDIAVCLAIVAIIAIVGLVVSLYLLAREKRDNKMLVDRVCRDEFTEEEEPCGKT